MKTERAIRDMLMSRALSHAALEPSFSRFLVAVVEASDDEDLAGTTPETFEAMFRNAFGRLGKRELASRSIHIVPPIALGAAEVVEVFSADMPFIVDSVLAAIRAHGGVVRALVHPVVEYDPATYQVVDGTRPGSRRESFLHVEIDPLPSLAIREALRADIDRTLTDVARAVAGWKPMLKRLQKAIEDWHAVAGALPAVELAEALQFLGWLADHNFVFLGMREYRLEGSGATARLLPLEDSDFGLFEDPHYLLVKPGGTLLEMTPEHQAFIESDAALMVTRSSLNSRVHRRAAIEYVAAKLYDEVGKVSGELRILGLFTTRSARLPNAEVPLVRRKVVQVLAAAGLDPDGHDGKALATALDTYPRDELFQIDPELLKQHARAIALLADRPRVRVLVRVDRFGSFVSALVFVPRERYDSAARSRIGVYLEQAFEARIAQFSPTFIDDALVRVHFVLARTGSDIGLPTEDSLEAAVTELTRGFADRLLVAAPDPSAIDIFLDAFPPAYVARYDAAAALDDIETIKLLPDEGAIALHLFNRGDAVGLKLYHRRTPLPLSDRVPLLENFGFRVIDEQAHVIAPRGTSHTYLHDMLLEAPAGMMLADRHAVDRVESAMLAVWRGDTESDVLNALVPLAGLGWDDADILRGLVRYLRQLGVPYSLAYMSQTLVRHPEGAAALVRLFHTLNDPHFAGYRDRIAGQSREAIVATVSATQSLDEDRILRHLAGLVEAVVRTNAYQRDETGARRPALAMKFDGELLTAAPRPRPYREIFVYAPRVEGLHMRFGPVARGGLRWSDRPEDYRTEVLALARAQQDKNAIIVPVGAKGAFVPRALPSGGSREAVLDEAVAAYRIFVSSLLDVTDTIEGDLLVPPPDVVRRDGDDPYLVVAADKGTASFSDIANAIAVGRDFWLGDAFASGGSAGYDHKRMGITARGAWEGVKRHFREMGRDAINGPLTAVGVGDMSGDVFGNGVLLPRKLKLVAAFDNRDIFIDPDPDPAVALDERRRLFRLERSSWQDYRAELISDGGGVYSRSLKDVPLTTPARAMLGLPDQPVTPSEVIQAILKADVDLIWFGGIGTYVKAADEDHVDVGDRANDGLRIDAEALRARVVAEGANLAMTQRARVAYALAGGRLNTDGIDNSAGVNSSDLEVNVKIAFGPLLRSGQLSLEQRDAELKAMTDEVATLCLRNNYLQTLAISLEELSGPQGLDGHAALMAALEGRGELRRDIDALPDAATVSARARDGKGLTRPELATLLARTKISINAALLRSGILDDQYLGRELFRYFPESLSTTHKLAVSQHRLRREIIATVLSNALVNRGGLAFVEGLKAASGADEGRIAAAYVAARDVFDTIGLNAGIDALDGTVAVQLQYALYRQVRDLVDYATRWVLGTAMPAEGQPALVTRLSAGVAEVAARLETGVEPGLDAAIAAEAQRLTAAGVDYALARRLAMLPALRQGLDIVLLAEASQSAVGETAAAHFALAGLLPLRRLILAAGDLVPADRFETLSRNRALGRLAKAEQRLLSEILAAGGGKAAAGLAAWSDAKGPTLGVAASTLTEMAELPMSTAHLALAADLVGDLLTAATKRQMTSR